jgi:hypothetical protein
MLKRLTGIFLLCLILFNTIGYYGVLIVIEHQLTAQILGKIDENADEISGDLMLTVPVDLPYSLDSKSYERVDGTIVYHGEVYRLVKQKIYHNNLYVVCIRDDRSTDVKEVMDEYSKTFTNNQSDKSDSAVKIVVSFAKYYFPFDKTAASEACGWNYDLRFSDSENLYHFIKEESVFRPPQLS